MIARRRAAALCVLLIGGTARAQDPPTDEPPPVPVADLGPKVAPVGLLDRPIGVTLSGGVSLGAYEAGYLHYVLRELHGLGVRPKIFTGTSAGSINAFIGVMEACGTAPRLPTDSLLYRMWMPMSLERLFRPEDVSDTSVLSRHGFDDTVKVMRKAWSAGLSSDCDVRLGTIVTRKTPRAIKVSAADVTIPRMTERFLVRIRGQGMGQQPLVENARTRELGRVLSLLPVDGPDAQPFDAMLEALLASSGVPLAFPAQTVHHCASVPKDGEVPRCTPADAQTSLFIDGAMFDNRPIGLAYSVLKEQAVNAERPALLFIDPSLHAWPTPDNQGLGRGKGVLPLVTKVLLDFIDTAMSAELERLIEREPDLERDLFIGQVYYPPASDPMYAFFGFIEQSLRRFDFYLGMYNARRFTAIERGVKPSELAEDGGADAADPAWRPLRCLRALWDHDGDPAQRCAGADLIDFRILAQLAGERVVSDCKKSSLGAESQHPLCIAAARGKPAPHVPGVRIHGDATRRPSETDTDWVMRRLGELGFEFRDLGLSRRHGPRGALVLRQRIGEIVDALARKQGAATLGYQLLATYGLNLIQYLPPQHLLHFVIGDRIEVGWSWTEPASPMRWARLAFAFGLRGLDTLLSSKPVYFGLAPTAGVDLEPVPLSRPSFQTRLGLHAGYLFSTGDTFLRGRCDVHGNSPCSRPLAEAVLSVAILGTLRLQLAATWLPAVRRGEPQAWAIAPGFGIQWPLVVHHTQPRP